MISYLDNNLQLMSISSHHIFARQFIDTAKESYSFITSRSCKINNSLHFYSHDQREEQDKVKS